MFAAVCRPHTGRPGVAGAGGGGVRDNVQQVVRADGDDAGSPLLYRHHQTVLTGTNLGRPGGRLQWRLAAQGGVTSVELLHPHVGHPARGQMSDFRDI